MTTSVPGRDDRQAIVNYVSDQLFGPLDGADEVLQEPPHKRYLTGILFHREAAVDAELQDDILDEGAGEAGEESGEDPIALASQQLPSSVGLSFVLPTLTGFRVEVRAGRYERNGNDWQRVPVELTGDQAPQVSPHPKPGRAPALAILDGRASLDVMWRPMNEGALVTVALVNQQRISGDGRMDPEHCLLQVHLRCVPVDGVRPYPSAMRVQTGDEEEELALLYRDVPTYAVGHGCAAQWDEAEAPRWVETSYLPTHTVQGVAFSLAGEPQEVEKLNAVLELERLASIAEQPAEVIAALDRFVDGYHGWAQGLEKAASTLDVRYTGAAERLL